LAIAIKKIKISCFTYVQTGKLRVDPAATEGEKQDNNAQGRRIVLIYRIRMHAYSALSP